MKKKRKKIKAKKGDKIRKKKNMKKCIMKNLEFKK